MCIIVTVKALNKEFVLAIIIAYSAIVHHFVFVSTQRILVGK